MPIRIRRGLDLPIAGVPEQVIYPAPAVTRVGLMGPDYLGLKPTMLVQEGDAVKIGQPLLEDKKNPGVRYTSPAAGRVVAIQRGEKRLFQSIVVEVSGQEQVAFPAHAEKSLGLLARDVVRDTLLASGMWTALRRRPYSRVPSPAETPYAIFVQAIDTNPLAPLPQLVIQEHAADFRAGLQVLKLLTDGTVHVCAGPGVETPGADPKDAPIAGVKLTVFDGPHPAGLPGTHIHFLAPASDRRPVWYLNYQDVIAIGMLFVTGRFWTERVISLAGPQVLNPRLLRAPLGAAIGDLVKGQLADGENRVISGSVLNGRIAADPYGFLGRYHLQVSALLEGREREFLGWQKPGFDKFSIKPVFASALASDGHRFAMTTSRNGSHRAIVPIGSYEAVMPLDIEPTYLLRALIIGDTDQAQALGALELDEEDLALCTFVDPGKHDFGPALRKILARIEKEG